MDELDDDEDEDSADDVNDFYKEKKRLGWCECARQAVFSVFLLGVCDNKRFFVKQK